MCFDLSLSKDEGDICEGRVFKHSQHVFCEGRFRYLHSNRENPNIVEAQFAIITSKDVQLTLNYIRCMTTPWSRLVAVSLYFSPSISFNVKGMNIVHPLHAIIATKIVDFIVD